MVEQAACDGVVETMRQINQAWLNGRVDDLASMVHPDVVMVFPGFAGAVQGRDDFLAGFRDFCQNARVHEFRDHDHQLNVAGDVAVATFRYDMIYERAGTRSRSAGRDLWVLHKQAGNWMAVWRTILEMEEEAA
jgi:ketosteroid isomerase-like protein